MKKILKKIFYVFRGMLPLSLKVRTLSDLADVQVKWNGLTIHAQNYGVIAFLIKEIFEKNEYHIQNKPKDLTIIDCGSNIGMSVLYFKKLYPESKIIAFEPNPFSFKSLEENVRVNNCKNVELRNEAVSNEDGHLAFYLNENPNSLRASFNESRGGEKELLVKTVKLSDVLKSQDVDVVKIDVEGAEHQVLKDLVETNTLTKCKHYMIEYHHNLETEAGSMTNFIRAFEDAGFRYSVRCGFKKFGEFQDVFLEFRMP